MKLKIGEFSKRNQVTIKTLRHYEEIELLMPSEIDDYTGYRYYDVSQMQDMNKIKYLKNLGFKLEEIKEMLQDKWHLPNSDMLAQKLETCRNDIRALQKREIELLYLYNQLTGENTMENFTIKSLPQIIVASYRTVINSYQDLFYLCPNVIGKEMERLGCECKEPGYCYTIDHSMEYKESNIDIEYCEEVIEKKQDSESITFKEIPAIKEALCFNHYGSYMNFPQSWAKIYAYIEEKGYQIIDHPRFSYIHGIWDKENESEWLTEIQVPITKNSAEK